MLDFMGWCLFFIFGLLVGFILGGEYVQDASIDAGVAYWDCAPDTGKCEFKFKGE
ncbi:MAG: hypothetical protein GOVbin631_28 [Prokaryotic dsDNA virus sp.]|nr:MAG: hypothetical protein GOVbin631_28 [Prokaryotic dsDNA virus sp.]